MKVGVTNSVTVRPSSVYGCDKPNRIDPLPEPAITIDEAAGVCTIQTPGNLLRHGRVELCLMQTAPTSPAAIAQDASRPVTVEVLRDLLAGSVRHAAPVASEFAPGVNPIVVITPEYAFGSGDWTALDAIVRASPRPVVLVAGFGAAAGIAVLDWAAEVTPDDQATRRHVTWDPAQGQLSGTRLVNGAWCWIHGFGDHTHAFVLLKNHLEQRHECVTLPTLQLGRTVCQLLFDDCELLPLICADLVQGQADGERTPMRRLQTALEPRRHSANPVLVTGSLYQMAASNENWAVAIETWLSTVARDRPALLSLANVAIDRPTADEARDRWRSLSGTFGRLADVAKNQANLPVARTVEGQGFRGVVLRSTEPYVACGPLWWGPYRPTGEQFYWHAGVGMPLNPEGIGSPLEAPADPTDVEIVRFTRRARAEAPTCPRTSGGFGALADHIAGQTPRERGHLYQSVLHGLDRDGVMAAETLGVEPQLSALMSGLKAVAALVGSDAIDFRTAVGQDGQLRVPAHDLNVLVWRDPTLSPRIMQHRIGAWAAEALPHPRLTVIAGGPHGGPDAGLVQPHPRDAFSDGPAANADLGLGGSLGHSNDDFTQTRVRQVACISIGQVANVYTDFVAADDAERTAILMTELVRHFPDAA